MTPSAQQQGDKRARRDGLEIPPELRSPSPSASEHVVGVLRTLILEGRIAPGTPLREVALAEALGVSRNTLRDGIKALVHEGLARHERNRGAVVVSLTHADAHDLYAMRRVLEVNAADRLPTAPAEALAAVSDAYAQLERAVRADDWTAVVAADVGFHRSIVGLHGSSRLLRCFRLVESELAYFLSFIRLHEQEEEKPEHILAEHDALRQAILARDTREARARIAAHLSYYEERAISQLNEPVA